MNARFHLVARSWKSLLIALLTLFVAARGQSAGATSKPNFLIFLADDMGFSDPGCYGGEISTPNLDVLAAHGIRYTQFYNTARCWPTRAALLTGYYAQQVGFDALPGIKSSDSRKRPPWARLLPEYLKPLGYRSYHSGKWHLDSSPVRCGFDHSYALLDFDHNFSPRNRSLDDRTLPPVPPGERTYSTIFIADRAIDFLKQHAREHRDEPFFAYVAFTVPHFPLQALPQDIAHYANRYEVGWDTIRRDRWQRMKSLLNLPSKLSQIEPAIGPPYYSERAHRELGSAEVWHETPWNQLSDEQRKFQASKMAIHAAMVERMDREIGRVLEQVREMHAEQNTLVLFFSDNGASAEIMIRGDGHDPAVPLGSAATFLCLGPGWSNASNTPFRRHKTWVHEGGIATPLIACWPAKIPSGGQLRHAVGHVIDLAPTILKLAGGTWPTEFEQAKLPTPPGHDLSPAFAADANIERDCLWWLHEGNCAIRKEDWKLVAARDEPWQLYDLANDRAENTDLAQQNPEKAKELHDLWNSKLTEFQKTARQNASRIAARKDAKAQRDSE